MWTNPGTWRKASPWSKPSGVLLPVVLLLAFATASGFPAETEKVFLRKGPKPGKGIEYFGPNAIPYEQAEYSYRGRAVNAYYIRSYIPILPSWAARDCGAARLSLLPGGGESESAFLYASGRDWYLIFVFAKEEKDTCPFIGAFLERVEFFLKADSGFPLPAVFDVKIP